MELYETGTANIWSDPYIRRQLLAAQLDARTDAASRKPHTVTATVDWIVRGHPAPGALIDLGCGPGFYCEEFARRGWAVLGVDINEAAIRHATNAGLAQGLSIRYRQASYLDAIDAGDFDLALCIYCDVGALTGAQRKTFLRNARALLAPGGQLVFDVFGPGISQTRTAGRASTREGANGFWSGSPCEVLSECQHFENEQVWGRKYTVIPESGSPATYVLWDHYFTVRQIESLLHANGFSMLEVNADLVRESDFTSSDVLFVRAGKACTPD